MSEEIEQFEMNLTAGVQAKEKGLDKVETKEAWMYNARATALKIAGEKGVVSTDDLRAVLPAPHHQNAWGAVFRGSQWVVAGYRQSAVVSNHARTIREWKVVVS